MYWDGHCHLTDGRWAGELPLVLQEAAGLGITGFVQGGYAPHEWSRQLDLQRQFSEYTIVSCFGLHPMWVAEASEEDLELGLDALVSKIVHSPLIGEVGLDAREAYRPAWTLQMEAFRSQLEIAGLVRKPLVLHIVRAHAEALPMLSLHRECLHGGWVHAFQGDLSTAKQYLGYNLALSIGAGVTRSHAAPLHEVVKWLPEEFLILETDSPDQKVKNWPSSLHRPSALWNIARIVAELRGETAENILALSTRNLRRILGM
jgi:TatD DNase family protein